MTVDERDGLRSRADVARFVASQQGGPSRSASVTGGVGTPFFQFIGNNSATNFDITHGFISLAPTVRVFESAGSKQEILVEVRCLSALQVRVSFPAVAVPTLNQFLVKVAP